MAEPLPSWRRVLVVVAHPDDESFGLGALVDGFVTGGAEVTVLCLTRGESSTLGDDVPDLSAVRAEELAAAAAALGVSRTVLRAETGGGFAGYPRAELVAVSVDRTGQLDAVHRHTTQAVPGSVLWRRLELLGDVEHVRWLAR